MATSSLADSYALVRPTRANSGTSSRPPRRGRAGGRPPGRGRWPSRRIAAFLPPRQVPCYNSNLSLRHTDCSVRL
jgi:hypothetical protein